MTSERWVVLGGRSNNSGHSNEGWEGNAAGPRLVGEAQSSGRPGSRHSKKAVEPFRQEAEDSGAVIRDGAYSHRALGFGHQRDLWASQDQDTDEEGALRQGP